MSAISDLEAIRRAIILYSQLFDDGRYEEWGDLFTQDAEYISVPGLHRPFGSQPQPWSALGRTDIVAKCQLAAERLRADGQALHLSGPALIEMNGGKADAQWDFMILYSKPESIVPIQAGRIYARFVKQDNRWLFAQRVSVQSGGRIPGGGAKATYK